MFLQAGRDYVEKQSEGLPKRVFPIILAAPTLYLQQNNPLFFGAETT